MRLTTQELHAHYEHCKTTYPKYLKLAEKAIELYGSTFPLVVDKTRKKDIIFIRFMVIQILRDLTSLTLENIGDLMYANKKADHSTIINALQKAEGWLSSYEEEQQQFKTIKDELRRNYL